MSAAGRLFRLHGFDGVGIDTIMAEAGLTRGGFYAHFKSKDELFAAVLSENHDLFRRLKEREGSAAELAKRGSQIFADYLDLKNFSRVGPNCTLSSLAAEAARASPDARTRFTRSIEELVEEVRRGSGGPDIERALLITALAVGALSLAKASNDKTLTKAILRASQRQVSQWMTTDL